MNDGAVRDTAMNGGAAPGTAAIILAGGRASRLGGADKASIEIEGRMLLDHVLAAVDGSSPVIVVGPSHLAVPPRSRVTFVQEDPPFTGPVAALEAGLVALVAGVIALADKPAPSAYGARSFPKEGHSAESRTKSAEHPSLGIASLSRRATQPAPPELPELPELPEQPAHPEETWLLACDLPRARDVVRLLSAPIPPGFDGVALVDAQGKAQWLAARYRTESLRDAVAALPHTAGASMRQLLGSIRVSLVADDAGASVDLDTWAEISDYRSSKEDHHG